MCFPTKIKDLLAIFFPSWMSEDDMNRASFGRWLVGVHFYKVNDTWRDIRRALEARKITAVGLKSSTGRYNPSSTGPGPVTTGVVSIYTTEENVDRVGFEVIEIVKQDIQYKTISASGQKRHKGDHNIILKTLSWNDGNPSFGGTEKSVWKSIRDKWHLNIEKAPSYCHESVVGYWHIECTIQNLTEFWHSLREQVVAGMMGPVKMECPAKAKKKGNPVVKLFTAKHDGRDVRLALINNKLIGSFSYQKLIEQSTPAKSVRNLRSNEGSHSSVSTSRNKSSVPTEMEKVPSVEC